jgi:Holliday junction resolvasome RuvABC endonuclease subunit
MRVLALDLSTSPGYAALDFKDGVPELIFSATDEPSCIFVGNTLSPEDFRFLGTARGVQVQVHALLEKFKPDFVAIEQTNQGRNRTTQKQLEFIHCLVLQLLESRSHRVLYVDSSMWRSTISLKLDVDQKRNNRIVKLQKFLRDVSIPLDTRIRYDKELRKLQDKGPTKFKGKVTWKHLAVAWVNEKFPQLKFKLKDNDRADAICLAFAANDILTRKVGHIDVDKIFAQ